jgi:N-acetylmuramate 1-kinase
MDRDIILNQWLKETLGNLAFHRESLAGDASFRRYYRIYSEKENWIVMDAPPPEKPQNFIEVANVLKARGLSVPHILASDLKEGFLLLSDLGDRLYLNELNDKNADNLYRDALLALIKLNHCEAEVPVFDYSFLERQWGIFKDWYLKTHLKIEWSPKIDDVLKRTLNYLAEVVFSQPFVFVHRDYHSRNLMRLDNGNPGILDFQDAMKGPITYDLVSLLQDCYITWPREKIVSWISDFKQYATDAQLLTGKESLDEFIRWFDLTGVLRHLKNCGIFSRLHYRDGKSHYLKDLPIPLQNSLESCERYQELEEFSSLMKELLKEKICEQ